MVNGCRSKYAYIRHCAQGFTHMDRSWGLKDKDLEFVLHMKIAELELLLDEVVPTNIRVRLIVRLRIMRNTLVEYRGEER